MANYKEQVMRVWDEWEATTGAEANNPDDFVAWALENKKLQPQPQDVTRLLRKRVTTVLRQAMRTDENDITYRAKQCVTILDKGVQLTLWFDTDKGGTPNLRQKAVRQRRDGIANDVYRAMCDVEHMKTAFPDDPQLNFFLDFHDDYTERKVAELQDHAKGDDKEAA